jgi:hypothetical protein
VHRGKQKKRDTRN